MKNSKLATNHMRAILLPPVAGMVTVVSISCFSNVTDLNPWQTETEKAIQIWVSTAFPVVP